MHTRYVPTSPPPPLPLLHSSCKSSSFFPTGRDVIAQAQSGTGKTATFAIAILQQLEVAKMACQALVLAPTRELAQQVPLPLLLPPLSPPLPLPSPPPPPAPFPLEPTLSFPQIQKVVIALGDYLDAQCHACIGGTNVRADIAKLELGQHIVVGTPGRVFDMITRRALGECGSSPTLLDD